MRKIIAGMHICLIRCKFEISTAMRLLDEIKSLFDDKQNTYSSASDYELFFKSNSSEFELIDRYKAIYKYSFQSLFDSQGPEEDLFENTDRNAFLNATRNRILIIEFHSFDSCTNQYIENSVDTLAFSYISLVIDYLHKKKENDFCFFFSGIPESSKHFTSVSDDDYYSARAFMFFQTIYGYNDYIYLLKPNKNNEKTENKDNKEIIWKRLYSDENVKNITNIKLETKDIFDDGFGKILPLIRIDEENFKLLQLPAYNLPKSNSLLRLRYKELLKNYTQKLSPLLSVDQKEELNSCLKADNLFEALFFASSLYYLFVTYKEIMVDLGIFHEQCMDYVQGLYQLIENAFFHVVSGEREGFGNLSLRIRKNNSLDYPKYTYEIYLTDFPINDFGCLGIVDTFCDNFQELADSGIILRNFFEEDTNKNLTNFLDKNHNIAYHYGLQILNNTVLTYNGYLSVRSGIGIKNFYSNRSKKNNDHTPTDPWPWHNGTAYRICIPIDIYLKNVNHQDSIAIKNLCDSLQPDESEDFRSINEIIRKMPVDISFSSSIKKVEYVEEKLKYVNSIKPSGTNQLNTKCYKADTIYKIDCSNVFTETQFEIIAKIVFLCLTQNDGLNNIALINLNTKYGVIKLFRQFALFYNRNGERIQLKDKCVFLVDNEAKLMLYMRGQINDIIADMQNLQIIGGLDETAMSIVGHLGEKNKPSVLSNETREYVNKIRSKYLQITIGRDNQKDKIWVKQLRNILISDIHKKPFGCSITNTHVKIGDIHIDTFYEAEVLFSHHYWVNQFVLWLYNNLFENNKTKSKPTVIIGYETYIEPVLYSLQQKAKESGFKKVYYGIYENPKYSQNLGYSKTGRNIRYIDSLKDVFLQDVNLVFLCGVSTTLNTFRKMHDTLKEQLGNNLTIPFPNAFLTLIQVLPKSSESAKNSNVCCKLFEIIDTNSDSTDDLTLKAPPYIFRFSVIAKKHLAISEIKDGEKITSKYLTSVDCNWYEADSCTLCALDTKHNLYQELPIISTNESSVVPSQMIESKDFKGPESSINKNKIDLFATEYKWIEVNEERKKIKKYTFEDYLYYGHMDRMDHHYIYYVRTAHLIKDILDNSKSNYFKKFDAMCKTIASDLFSDGRNYVDIIVFPADSGDEVFPTAINHLVFNDQAHMLSVEPNKEFRSNFGTKHSNISYFIEQTRSNAKENKLKIRFHYVSKQLIASETFSRIKSLVTSLMHDPNPQEDVTAPKTNDVNNKEELEKRTKKNDEKEDNNSVIFSDIIVFLSRNSEHSKRNYISDTSKYYSFVDVSVPSIRYYGDACPMCKLALEANAYKEASLLKINAEYWKTKEEKYRAKSFDVLKDKNKEYSFEIRERYFRRFHYEDQLFKLFKTCFTTDDYLSVMGQFITHKNKKTDVEEVISLIKVVSSPFLFYRENEKKAALKFIINIFDQYLHHSEIIYVPFNSRKRQIYFNDARDKYLLLVICLNSLAKMDSTALLSVERIRDLHGVVSQLFPDALTYDTASKIPGFYSCIIYNCKRIICGISGKNRANAFEKDIISHLQKFIGANSPAELFWLALLLDNISEPSRLYETAFTDINEKYTTGLLNQIAKKSNIPCKFVYMENDLINIFGESHLSKKVMDDIKHLIKRSYDSSQGFAKSKSRCAVLICSAQNAHYNLKSSMFLLFDFNSKQITIDDYLSIRECLSYRSSLEKTIMPDLINNTIKDALTAKAAVRLIGSRKAVNHSGFEDVFDQSQTIGFLITNWYKSNIVEKKNYFKNACQMINSFMGRCIAINGTQEFIQDYYNRPNGYDSIKTVKSSFDNSCLPLSPQDNDIRHNNLAAEKCDYDNSEISLAFFKEYLKELCLTETSVYWMSYRNINQFKPINNGFTVNLYINDKTNSSLKTECINAKTKDLDQEIQTKIILPLKRINKLPSFLNQSSTDSHQPYIHFLVGILDTLIRNVYKHSSCNYVDVYFTYDLSFYSFEIRNEIDSKLNDSGTGLTEQFFISLNEMRHPDCDEYTINMAPKGSRFCAELRVFRK